MDRRCAPDSPSAPSPPELAHWPSDRNPQRRREVLAAAESLRRDLPVLWGVSARAVRSAVRAYFAAGWTVADVEHALDHLPDGSRHIRTDAVRSPARWLAYRLDLWRSADGTPLPPHTAELAEQAARHQAEQATYREALAATRAQVGDYRVQASRARAMLNRALATPPHRDDVALPHSNDATL